MCIKNPRIWTALRSTGEVGVAVEVCDVQSPRGCHQTRVGEYLGCIFLGLEKKEIRTSQIDSLCGGVLKDLGDPKVSWKHRDVS